ncbi:MAG: hypothetical protein WDA35_05195 [Bacilli bacterium]
MAEKEKTQKKDEKQESGLVKLVVRTKSLSRRFRAGLGPFHPEPEEVEATPEQEAALRADPELVVNKA